ncbi:hypothetical protein BpHYR1_045305 [Brachionus plicatilis]|uniref:Uncharacterized protein n=1 Tax=Brachionus plicatilis TaxID=10195 RepID=A0A3M7SSK1_BRAPC|nr:hypothetical protein BpHYR1_045305 [Brachionus plicatilis]
MFIGIPILSSTNRMNFNENSQDKNSDYPSLAESGMKTVRVNSSNTNLPKVTEQKHQDQVDKSTGVVRRLSVTARPGDIFYKVKDVTETSSNTDNSEANQENEEQEIVIKPQETAMNTWRRTTTWNSKRTQQKDCESGRQTPRQEPDNSSAHSNIEPGSPMFAKELLSIRQLLCLDVGRLEIRCFTFVELDFNKGAHLHPLLIFK